MTSFIKIMKFKKKERQTGKSSMCGVMGVHKRKGVKMSENV